MAISDFYPFQPGVAVTAAQWNELMQAVQSGEFFLDAAPIATQLNGIAARISSLELQVARLNTTTAYQKMRDQFSLAAQQVVVTLDETPRLDSEVVFLNGAAMSKSGIPVGFTGDYSISGSTITFNPEWQPQIRAGDMVVVSYEVAV